MVHLNVRLVTILSTIISGCGFLSDTSYEDDLKNDRKILQEIIKVNPVLDSAEKAGHYFMPIDVEHSRVTGWLDFSGIGLSDSNFYFPINIRNFRLVEHLDISFNHFVDVPRGIKNKGWRKLLITANNICNPSAEIVEYFDSATKETFARYWRDSQRCGDSIPAASP